MTRRALDFRHFTGVVRCVCVHVSVPGKEDADGALGTILTEAGRFTTTPLDASVPASAGTFVWI